MERRKEGRKETMQRNMSINRSSANTAIARNTGSTVTHIAGGGRERRAKTLKQTYFYEAYTLFKTHKVTHLPNQDLCYLSAIAILTIH